MPEPQVQLITTTQQFEALRPDWEGLFARDPHSRYFQSYAWNWHAWKHLAQPGSHRLCIVCVQEQGRTVLILPLVARRSWLWIVAGALSNRSSEYTDALVEPHPRAQAWLEAAFQHLATHGGISALRLRQVREDASLTSILCSKQFMARGGARTRIVGIDWRCVSSWDDYYAGLRSNLRKDQRRHRKRLSEKGDWRIELVPPEDMASAIRWTLKEKLASLTSRGFRSEISPEPAFEDFLLSVVDEAHRTGNLAVYRLVINGATIAVTICFRTPGHTDGWMCAYDPAWRSFSPGNLLLEHVLRATSEESPDIDFGPGGHAYKLRWSQTEHACWTHAMALKGWGRCYVALWGLKWGIDPLRKGLLNRIRGWMSFTARHRPHEPRPVHHKANSSSKQFETAARTRN